jgi:hypothetical protein
MWLVIGTLTPFLLNTGRGLIITERTDTIYFGRTPKDVLETEPAVGKLRTLLLYWISGFLIAAGVAFVSLTWFGLRDGHTWALATLAVAGIAGVALWVISLVPYARAGVHFSLGEVPPFIWLPAACIPVATILGWIGV